MNLEESVRRVIVREGMTSPGDRVLVCVSGGMDSSALLSILNRLTDKLEVELAVAHVNHQLRGEESERDEAFVRDSARDYGLVCHVSREDVTSVSHAMGISVQHAGREIRYRFFHNLAATHGYNRIAVAHNRDDQVETFLLRVIKGTGINGLSSIPIKRGLIIRPLLCAYRSEIEDYVRMTSLAYVEDSSNRKDGYERNFLRHHIVPLMARLNPVFREKVLSLLSDISTINHEFDSETKQFMETQVTVSGEESSVGAEALRSLPEEVRFRVISHLLSRLEPRFIPLREHILLVEKSLFSTRPNNSVLLPHGIRVKRAYNSMGFTQRGERTYFSGVFAIEPGENRFFKLNVTIHTSHHDTRPDAEGGDRMTALLDADKVGPLSVRTFRDGDRFVPLGMKEPTKLKNYFISRKIPREQRRSIPLVTSGTDIVWIVGERISELHKVTGETKRFLRLTASPLE
jgi:tRNA(Ile)-lysidine synthase